MAEFAEGAAMRRVNILKKSMAVACVALAGTLLPVIPAPVVADTAPAGTNDPLNPPTVSAEGLPTVQIDGVVWTQEVVGDTVYVGGQFTTARPAGAAPGQNTVPRANLLAYDIRNGQLINAWAPTTNGPVLDITASPDGSRIYVAGQFTNINGQTKNRIAALNPTTGAIIQSFQASSDATVRTVAATDTSVYFGGLTTAVNGVARYRVAAVEAANGALLPWAPVLEGGTVRALDISPDGSKVFVGGHFTTTNGSGNPGYGLAFLDASTGAQLPLAANSLIRNGGSNAAITAISVDDDSVYVSGYVFGSGGNLEGTARITFDGTLAWVQDCHGDTYSTFVTSGVVYTATHAHYCGNVPGGFSQFEPQSSWKYYHAMAWSKPAAHTLMTEYLGYFNFAGRPAPQLLHWFPQFSVGSFTGQSQAAWNLDGNDDYLVAGGEFPTAGGRAQQGLVRFPRNDVKRSLSGPVLSGASAVPQVTSPAPNTALITWETNWDRDNEFLTYNVIRNGNINNPAHTVTVSSDEWDRPYLSWIDTDPTRDLVAGQQIRYRIFAVDPDGNESRSDTVNLVGGLAQSGEVDDYARAVLADGPMHYWRLNEASGSVAADYTGLDPLTLAGTVTRGVSGAISGDSATTFSGQTTTTGYNQTSRQGPWSFSVEAWFRGGSTAQGKIIGYGNVQTGNSGTSTRDRTLYIGSNGTVNFGVRQRSSNRTVTSPGTYRDDNWHHVVGVVSDEGMYLYVDGVKVGQDLQTRSSRNFLGYWRVGGDAISGFANAPTDDNSYFNGDIDEVAVYRRPLTANQVRAHYLASARAASTPSDTYGKAVYQAGPDHFWRFGETSGTTAADSSGNGAAGTYTNGPVLGGESSIGLVGDRSAAFDGVDDFVAGPNTPSAAQLAPAVYSTQLWFKTTSTTGGRLIGFGNSRTSTLSTTRDRHIYLGSDGRVRFGVEPNGQRHVIESAGSYNDGTWHHVVATQNSAGMRLYVDGVLVASGPQVQARQYTTGTTLFSGYWRVGGDNLSGWQDAGSNYLRGSIDEVAVYRRALTATEVAAIYLAGGGTTTNQSPVAVWSSTVDGLSVSFDGSGSSDPDGSIVSYAWDFGDGTTGTVANPTKVYSAAGTYTVSLTVTDNLGATGTLAGTVTVAAPPPGNQSPVAVWSSTVDGLSVSFDGSGSSDPDGSIVSYAWDFGDGTTGTVANPTKVYSAAGTYTVSLTVTDNLGATGTLAGTVTVAAPPPAGLVAQDDFARTVTNGWGSAPLGGAWSLNGSAGLFQVNNGSGVIRMASAGAGPRAVLAGVSQTDSDVSVMVSLDKVANGGGAFVSLDSRVISNGSYRAKVRVDAVGRVTLYLTRVAPGETTLVQTLLPASLTYAAGEQLVIRLQTEGTGSTTLRAKVWKVGTAEPAAWQLTATDITAALQGPGGFGLVTYLSGSSTSAPVEARFDNLNATTIGAPPPPGNQSPVAVWSSTVDGLSVSFNGSGSSDPDGSIVSYAWDFGDGTTGTVANPTKVYSAAGTYTVSLTVTDNLGATGTLAGTVTVAAPPPGNQSPVAVWSSTVDGLSVSFDGSGSSDPDGSIVSYAWDFGDGTTGTVANPTKVYSAAGTYTVSLTVTDNLGATGTLAGTVTVAAPPPGNQSPVAVWSSTVDGLSVSFDGSGSSDPDGSIVSYAWDFGDGTTGTVANPTKVYSAAGTYTVSLTVTDNLGATGTLAGTVTVAAPPPAGLVAQDDFARTVTNGWGSAPLGGAWSLNGSAGLFQVNNGSGVIRMASAGAGPRAVLAGVSQTDSDVSVMVSLDKVANGGGAFVSLDSRVISNGSYRAKVRVDAVGRVTLYLTRVAPGETTLVQTLLPASLTYAAGEQLVIRLQTEGTGSTTLRAKVWKVGTAEPAAWQLTATDITAALQGPGGFGLVTYLSGSSTSAPVEARFDNLNATTIGAPPPPGNQSPVAVWSSTVDGLSVSFDGSGSSDPDGSIVSYAWDFGDGTTGTVANPTKVYSAAGTYTVSLTVTDNLGATGTLAGTVTVAAPPPGNQSPVAVWSSTVDGLSVSFDGSGSSDPDGSIVSYAWDFGDGTTGTVANPTKVYSAAGTYTVSLTVTDNLGATGTLAGTVTVAAPPPGNQSPVAVWSSTVDGLSVSFDGSGSSDPDGSIVSYAWDFGDGTTGTVANPTKVYSAAGTYTVSLTVTDNLGATGTLAGTVTVAAPPPAGLVAQDDFARTVTNGWGSAPLGGAWSLNGSAGLFQVNNGSGVIRMASAGAGPRAVLAGVSQTDSDVSVMVSLDKVANGGGAFVSLDSRVISNGSYRAKVRVDAVGRVTLYLTRVNPGETTLVQTLLPASLTYAAGEQLVIRLQTEGTGSTTLRAKVWKVGTAEPAAWQLTATDITAALQGPGGFGLVTYLSGSSTSAPVEARFDNLNATTIQ
jgi:PKD repeat protein